MNQGLLGWPMPRSAAVPYINVQDRKATGTAGGTFTSGAWRTRDLNTIQADSAGIASLAANQLTLPPGTYRCYIRAPGRAVGGHQARLRNIAAGTNTLIGSSCIVETTQTASDSVINGRFTIDATTVFEVQHQCSTTLATTGFGAAMGFTVDYNVYTVAEFWKES